MKFTSYQKAVIAILTFLQFTVILDFMILSPLGAALMPALKISPTQFGLVVSVYAVSAGISGFLAAGFADRYDRKKLLLFFYVGFILGTLFCGLAPNFHMLLAARMVTGLFGGVLGAICGAIATDLFEYELRGRVMGLMQTAFAASQILGIPAGLYLSNLWGWHAPFLMIVVFGSVAGVLIWMYLKPVDGHLHLQAERSPLRHLTETVKTPQYLLAYVTMALLTTGGFMLMPFSSAYTVNNLGISMAQLPIIYLISGICAIVIGPMIGKASDNFGKYRVFIVGSLLMMVMVVIYTNLGITPLPLVILINAIMFLGVFSRMIPAQTLMSAIPSPANRGAFMSVSSSIQSVSGGIASVIAGLIVVEGANGSIEHFDTLGYIIVGVICVTLSMMYMINKNVAMKVETKP
ncbi:MFS transporter [Bdellovibrio sp. HCB-162]|uniref:MFS transporter n=1 Tax=Bdellovibrio sp. HCB-162 TaxID=3394234 RepID=UPI0039BD0927